MLPSNFTAATVPDLIADINAAKSGDTITLAPNTTFDLTAVDNTTNGANGLPVIKRNLTIIGQGGDIIQRDTAAPDFRLFEVASGASASLTLENLTLQNGLAFGSCSSSEGGAIYNQGTLILSGAIVAGNHAVGSNGAAPTARQVGDSGQDAAGGAIWSNGSLTLENGTQILGNVAQGGNGGDGIGSGIAINFSLLCKEGFANGGNASGGGVYVASGTASFMSATLSNNTALGGESGVIVVPNFAQATGDGGSAYGGALYVAMGGVSLTAVQMNNNAATGGSLALFGSADISCKSQPPPANGDGGGIYVAAGTLTLCNDTVENNTAQGGQIGTGSGGGIYIVSGATVDVNTVANIINNSPDNIVGPYILRNC
jgi:hypothetical protein